jgi:hypothetical protein
MLRVTLHWNVPECDVSTLYDTSRGLYLGHTVKFIHSFICVGNLPVPHSVGCTVLVPQAVHDEGSTTALSWYNSWMIATQAWLKLHRISWHLTPLKGVTMGWQRQ